MENYVYKNLIYSDGTFTECLRPVDKGITKAIFHSSTKTIANNAFSDCNELEVIKEANKVYKRNEN